MKKIFIICSAVIAAMTLTTNADAQISVSAGYNLISHTTKIKGGESTSTPQQLSGIFINGSYCYELMTEEWGVLSVEPGLTWSFGSTKIANQDVGRAISGSREKRREHYLDLPINARYDYDLMPGKVKLSGFAGPIISFGLASSLKSREEWDDTWIVNKQNLYTGKYTVKSSDKSLNSTGDMGETHYSRFDIKLGLGIGATVLEKYNVRLGYNIGLLNRAPGYVTGDYKFVQHTNVFYFGVGYNF